MTFNQTRLIESISGNQTSYEAVTRVVHEHLLVPFLIVAVAPILAFIFLGMINEDARMNITFWMLLLGVIFIEVLVVVFVVVAPLIPLWFGS